ncbi:MAG: YezD family protein [Actinobacteria bacterium]|nr:YezD family protein [Actinomycetota bacterium]
MAGRNQALPAERRERETEVPLDVLARVARAIQEVDHGYITIIVQDGQVIQIDKTEKIRLR